MRGKLQALFVALLMVAAMPHSSGIAPSVPSQQQPDLESTLDALFSTTQASIPLQATSGSEPFLIRGVCSITCEPCVGSCPKVEGHGQTCAFACN
jgi:hypothetical protein